MCLPLVNPKSVNCCIYLGRKGSHGMKGGVDAGGGLDALVCKKLSAFEHARERQKLTVSFALPSIHGSTAIHLSRPLNLIQGEEHQKIVNF
jgi:hypothetical protein